jgi:hypothetical protein
VGKRPARRERYTQSGKPEGPPHAAALRWQRASEPELKQWGDTAHGGSMVREGGEGIIRGEAKSESGGGGQPGQRHGDTNGALRVGKERVPVRCWGRCGDFAEPAEYGGTYRKGKKKQG